MIIKKVTIKNKHRFICNAHFKEERRQPSFLLRHHVKRRWLSQDWGCKRWGLM